ncbi:MAG: N-6 DNA methylase [Candidatus Methanoperedens sp.]|nr:N-6 DNA methylase [Candidatus Methanoperedens sp.]
MSRLIFIKFLEDKGLVERNLLQRLLKEYGNVKIPATFYKTYLQPLFYDVFNTPPERRKSNVNNIIFFKKIPYLNGGLFREIIPQERESDVDNEIIEVIIKDLLEKYSFTLNGDVEGEKSLNPDILGNVFEKTINYLTGEDENDKRKELGAYYTPEEVTSFISKNTIHPVIFEKIKNTLKRFGWKDADINSYKSLTGFLDNTPKSNPEVLKAIYDEINGIKILDPACGSGHFLTSAMKELIFIKKKLQDNLEKESYYTIKRQIISNNLHGVDIETSAIEIAKLRLWLSLIENLDVSDISHLETLPNIEYKIIDGNSLIGWINEEINQNVALTSYDDRIQGIFEGLKIAYVEKPEKFKLLSESEELLSTQGGRLVDNLKRAYSNLQILYSQEDGEKAVRLREILVTIRNAIYTVISPSFQKYIIDKSNSKKRNKKETVEKYNISNQFHWNIDFGNVISSGGFDIIIENPPYGIDIKENERLYIPQVLPCTNEYVNSALAFIERSYYLAKEGGYIGLIVPKSLAYVQKWCVGRKLIKDDLDTIVDAGRAFKDVKLEQVIIILKKGSASKSYKVKDIDGTSIMIPM